MSGCVCSCIQLDSWGLVLISAIGNTSINILLFHSFQHPLAPRSTQWGAGGGHCKGREKGADEEGSQIPYSPPPRPPCHIFLGKLSPPPQAHALHRLKTRVSRLCPNIVTLWYLVPASGHGQPIGALKGRGFNEGDLYPQ